MASTVTIRRSSGSTQDGSGNVTYTGTVVYTGRASVDRLTTAPSTVTYGGEAQTTVAYGVTVPRGTNVREGDTATVTSSPDPVLAGLTMRVVDASGSDWSASRVLRCEV